MQTSFGVEDFRIEGVKLITPFYCEDARGYFMKGLEKEVFHSWNLDLDIYEEFESYSKQGVLRGMHFQTDEPQIKIVHVIKGKVQDVIVDLRKGSPTYGAYLEFLLSDENHHFLWVPRGFAHGFLVLSEDAIMSYQCIGRYLKNSDSGICWNDSTLNIPWQNTQPVISERDQKLMSFMEFSEKYKGL